MPLPTMLQSITFATSEHDERVQLADVLAGSAAYVFAARTGAKPSDRFARDLERGLASATSASALSVPRLMRSRRSAPQVAGEARALSLREAILWARRELGDHYIVHSIESQPA